MATYTRGVVYVAGPFRANNAWEIEQNVRRAETLALDVWRRGFACICPHTNTRFYQGAHVDKAWLAGDLDILAGCDAILMLEDWKNSTGATEEHDFALNNDIPVFYTIEELDRGL